MGLARWWRLLLCPLSHGSGPCQTRQTPHHSTSSKEWPNDKPDQLKAKLVLGTTVLMWLYFKHHTEDVHSIKEEMVQNTFLKCHI